MNDAAIDRAAAGPDLEDQQAVDRPTAAQREQRSAATCLTARRPYNSEENREIVRGTSPIRIEGVLL
jgi:hypothetical protein